MTKTSKKDEVATVANAALVGTDDYAAYAGQGFESHTQADYSTPFLGVIQALSPIVNEKAEAKAGMLINTVTQEIYDGKAGIQFIPAATEHVVVEWKPRAQGGGFVKIHQMNDAIVIDAQKNQEFGKWKSIKGDINSNELIETFYIYGVAIKPDGMYENMIIAYTGSKIKVYKRWMTKARTVQMRLSDGRVITPPIFAHKFRLTTVQEKNAKGNFFNFQVEFEGGNADAARISPKDPIFIQASEFAKFAKEGKVKAAHESQETTTGSEEPEAEIPFA